MTGGWDDYWAQAGTAGRGGGCLPAAEKRIAATLEAQWHGFARGLRRRASVIDLATGDGVVLRQLAAARSDLSLTGVDSAAKLPPAPPRVRLMAGVAMEALPFPDASFAAVTSQFGLEYGDVERIAAEAARLLSGDGRLRAIVHHRGSGVFEHNMARRNALRWASEESGLIDKGRHFAAARARVAMPMPPSFRRAVGEAQQRYPSQSVAAEIAAAVVQALEYGTGQPPRASLDMLDGLEARARGELARLDALHAAACDEAAARRIADALSRHGLAAEAPQALHEPGTESRPLAWLIDAARS